ncbi:40S small subunit processome assembly factor 1 [Rhinoderma darwinii]|uniref:40S small subunit processome assembly factor 1 n=1 Tax=Rhinoderma darwinii TaxID=43563 RepID=UPI003F6693E2
MTQVRDQLDSVLSSLYDFGDDFVTPEENLPEHGQMNGLSEEKEVEKANGSVEDQRPVVYSKRGKKNVSMFFDSIKEELCSQAKNSTLSSTSASMASSLEVVTFVSRKDKEIINIDTEKNDETEEDKRLAFNFEKARLEVHKFGITGYKKEKQRKFEQERAIMLGAKPPKREYVNYKLFQEKKKEMEEARKEKNLQENSLEPVRKKHKQGKNDWRSRKTKGSRTAPSGQVGRFRNGALILSGKDIAKIKKSKIIK